MKREKPHHVCIPTALSVLVRIGGGDLRVCKIKGIFSRTVDTQPTEKTRFSRTTTTTRIRKILNWGKCAEGKPSLPFSETVPLQQIYDEAGNAMLSELGVQIWRKEQIETAYGTDEFDSPVLFYFTSWSFKPGFAEKYLSRMPSGSTYAKIKEKREEITDDPEVLKRFRDTWLVNKPPRKNVTLDEYKAWFGNIAMILPESIGDFKGRELGG